MCGIAGVFGPGATREAVAAMVRHQRHRGPDAQWVTGATGALGILGVDRLAVIDRSPAADRPLRTPAGTQLAFNGELYNHVELRTDLAYPFTTHTDAEVFLAAHDRWGEAAFGRSIGMFAALLWNERSGRLLAVRDRFGVKPLHYHHAPDGTLWVASEIGALLAAGVPAVADAGAWAGYLTTGRSDGGPGTFWEGVRQVPAGHLLRWEAGRVEVEPWYDLVAETGADDDPRPLADVEDEYRALLEDSVRLRFRSDVPVGINLSGGLDSATLLALVRSLPDEQVAAYTFSTGDERYDETPWVRQMLSTVAHRSRVTRLRPEDVPALARAVQRHQDGPFGGLPTLAYAQLFSAAREDGTVVLLDGQGMDEQWAGYDYYEAASSGGDAPVAQGGSDRALRPEAVLDDLAATTDTPEAPPPFADPLRRLQHRDLVVTKLPRALRFNDRVSMRASTELREPFLDHRLVQLALRQPADRKRRDGTGKWLLRRITGDLLPDALRLAPKRPVQTPQREWLRGPLRAWADERIEHALAAVGGRWLDPACVRREWRRFADGHGDHGLFAWQWINLGLAVEERPAAFGAEP